MLKVREHNAEETKFVGLIILGPTSQGENFSLLQQPVAQPFKGHGLHRQGWPYLFFQGHDMAQANG